MQMEQPNAMSLTVRKKSNFVWKEMGFTECSESCLGGEFGPRSASVSRISFEHFEQVPSRVVNAA